MPCRNINEMLSPYIDGMLEASQAAQVEQHIAACAACRTEYDKLRTVVELVKGLPEVTPPSEFHSNLLQKLQTLPTPSVSGGQTVWIRQLAWGKWSQALAVAAVLMLTVGVTALWYGKTGGGLAGSAIQLSDNHNIAERYGNDAEDSDRALKTGLDTAKGTKAAGQENSANSTTPDQGTSPGNFSAPGVSASDQQPTALSSPGEQSVAAAEDGAGEQVTRALVAPEGQPVSDAPLYTMMAAPSDNSEPTAIISKNAVPVASEITAAVTLNNPPTAVANWSETAAKYGGFVETKPQQPGEYWILRIPTGSVDGFIAELNNLGQADMQTNTSDLAADLQQAEEQLNALREKETTLVAQLETVQSASTAGADELMALREQITRQAQAVADLQKDVNFARVNLYVK